MHRGHGRDSLHFDFPSLQDEHGFKDRFLCARRLYRCKSFEETSSCSSMLNFPYVMFTNFYLGDSSVQFGCGTRLSGTDDHPLFLFAV